MILCRGSDEMFVLVCKPLLSKYRYVSQLHTMALLLGAFTSRLHNEIEASGNTGCLKVQAGGAEIFDWKGKGSDGIRVFVS
jgi:hypothetical protein